MALNPIFLASRPALQGRLQGCGDLSASSWVLFPDSIIGIRTTTTTTWKVPTIAKVETGPQSCCSELMKRNSQMTQRSRPFLHLFARYLLSIPLLSTSLSSMLPAFSKNQSKLQVSAMNHGASGLGEG